MLGPSLGFRSAGLGPALARRLSAPSHCGASRLVCALHVVVRAWPAFALVCSSCNIGHNTPELAPEEPRESEDSDESAVGNDAAPTNDGGSDTASDSVDYPSDADVGSASGTDATGGEDTGLTTGTPTCDEGAYRCIQSGAPDRERCEQGVWVSADSCGRGRVCEFNNASTTTCVVATELCDGGECESACQVGTIACDYVEGASDVALSCPSGSTVRNTCNEETPHCVNAVGCKECSQTAHCDAAPPDCYEYTCNDDFQCELVAMDAGQVCSTGVCSADSTCVQCNAPEDCGQPSTCHHFACNANLCEEQLDNERSSCESDAGNYCNAEGACVECLTENDCSSEGVPECYEVTCDTGACTQVAAAEYTPCTPGGTGVCDGLGVCAACLTAEQCDEEQVCHERECVSSNVHVGWFDEEVETSSTVYPGYVYLRRVEPLAYAATLESFGQIAHVDTNQAIYIGLYEDNGSGTGPQGAPLTVLRVAGFTEGYQANGTPLHPELEAGAYYWLGFRVTADIELRYGAEADVEYGTGARIDVEDEDLEVPLFEASGNALDVGFDTEPFGVFAVVRFTQ